MLSHQKKINGPFQVRDHLNLPSHRINDPEKDAVWERSERKRVMGCVQLSRSLNARMNSLEVN